MLSRFGCMHCQRTRLFGKARLSARWLPFGMPTPVDGRATFTPPRAMASRLARGATPANGAPWCRWTASARTPAI